MKKGFGILMLAFMLFSCSSNKDTISDFEEVLDTQNSADLNNFVNYFENQVLNGNFDSNDLSNKYSNLNQDCFEKGAISLMENQKLDLR